MIIALLSCSASKQNYPCTAKEMYAPSQLFSLAFAYAKQQADRIYILSGKYGLLEPNEPITPYNMALTDLSGEQRAQWTKNVLAKLRTKCDFEHDTFLILTGQSYCIDLLPCMNHYSLPLKHRRMGERLMLLQQWVQHPDTGKNAWMNALVSTASQSDACMELHALFNTARRYTGAEIDQIPFQNGIYIVFERGETIAQKYNRIVRVGTHTSQDRLKLRLKDHFLRENKDASIFRKNIGKAMLNRARDPYLSIWTLDTSKPANMRYINAEKQRLVEHDVTDYLNRNIKYTVIRVDDAELRLRLEAGLIATLHQSKAFHASETWLGNSSTEQEIRDSGMWLKQGLDAAPLSAEEMTLIRKLAVPTPASIAEPAPREPVQQKAEPKHMPYQTKTSSAAEIRAFIAEKFNEVRLRGEETCVLTSGAIHREMQLRNKMPSVCDAMYRMMHAGDEVLHTTPSGHSSTICIRYMIEK